MSDTKWIHIHTVYGHVQAELLKGLLNAQGIDVQLFQEGAGKAYGLEFGPMSEVQFFVAPDRAEEAKALLDAYYAGDLYAEDDTP